MNRGCLIGQPNMLYKMRRRQTEFPSFTSIMAITLSLFVLRTCITFSHVDLKLPSIPLTSMAFTSILVKRNGTCSRIRPLLGEVHCDNNG